VKFADAFELLNDRSGVQLRLAHRPKACVPDHRVGERTIIFS
jgi:hypothetical protein